MSSNAVVCAIGAARLEQLGHGASPPTVGRLLRKSGYSLRIHVKKQEASAAHADRQPQFEVLESQKWVFQEEHNRQWWPAVTPSTADATIGGCVAMNVNGKNAWKCGSFGEHLLSLTVLLATGQVLTLTPESNPQFFQALVGSAGLLGIITSITLQLQRITSGSVDVLVRSAASLGEIFTIFQEEYSADFLESWVDGFAGGRYLGRGIVTCTRFSDMCDKELFTGTHHH